MTRNGPPDEPSLPYLIHRIARRIDARVNALARSDGLKTETIRLLLRLAARDHQRVGDLAEATSIEQSALSHMLKRLECDGLIARSKVDDDSRSTVVSLTLRGRRLARTYEPVFRELEAQSLAELSLPERRRLKEILIDVYARLGASDAPPARHTQRR